MFLSFFFDLLIQGFVEIQYSHVRIWGRFFHQILDLSLGFTSEVSLDMQISSWVVVSNIFNFHPYLGKWSKLTSIFFIHGLVQPPPSKPFWRSYQSYHYCSIPIGSMFGIFTNIGLIFMGNVGKYTRDWVGSTTNETKKMSVTFFSAMDDFPTLFFATRNGDQMRKESWVPNRVRHGSWL